jgi:hypothetical protein
MKKRRRRPLAAPPPEDGLVPVPVWDAGPGGWVRRVVLMPADMVQAHHAEAMARHDRRHPHERWGGNQWGEGWVTRPGRRDYFEQEAPLLATDLTWGEWRGRCR